MCNYTTPSRKNSKTTSVVKKDTNNNNNTTTATTAKKQVRFKDEKLEQHFEYIIDDILDQDRKAATWMTRADFRAIHIDILRAVQQDTTFMMGQGAGNDLHDDDKYCFRGLEPLTSCGRKVQIQAFVQDLLEMQELSSSPNGLHAFSENNSKSARERARVLGDRDASEAQRVYAESILQLGVYHAEPLHGQVRQ